MKSNSIKLVSALLLTIQAGRAATLTVLPDTSIQTKIDLAQPGDIVAIFGGTYAQDVTVNKAIRLTEVDGEDVTITGNITFTGITNAPPFEGFVVGSPGKGITITNTTGLVLKSIDARPGSGVVVNGTSKVGITGGFYSQISQDGGELATTLAQVAGTFNTTINSLKTVAFRTVVNGSMSWNSFKSWFGYSKARVFHFTGSNSSVILVGCELDGVNGIQVNGLQASIRLAGANNRIQVANCILKNIEYGDHPDIRGQGIVIEGNTNQASIHNNYFHLFMWPGFARSDWGRGVLSESTAISVYNNIFQSCHVGVSAPYGARVINNFFSQTTSLSTTWGGLVPIGSLVGDPLYVVNQAPNLQPASPCINAGISDPIFNDLDGTRNDIGPSGGSLFDPDGWTTANPVVISFDLAPQQLLKGVDTQVTLSSGQAVSQP